MAAPVMAFVVPVVMGGGAGELAGRAAGPLPPPPDRPAARPGGRPLTARPAVPAAAPPVPAPAVPPPGQRRATGPQASAGSRPPDQRRGDRLPGGGPAQRGQDALDLARRGAVGGGDAQRMAGQQRAHLMVRRVPGDHAPGGQLAPLGHREVGRCQAQRGDPAGQVRRALLVGAGLAQVDRVLVVPDAPVRVAGQPVDRPARRDVDRVPREGDHFRPAPPSSWPAPPGDRPVPRPPGPVPRPPGAGVTAPEAGAPARVHPTTISTVATRRIRIPPKANTPHPP